VVSAVAELSSGKRKKGKGISHPSGLFGYVDRSQKCFSSIFKFQYDPFSK
jgi:hypothetical protein